MNQPAFAAVTDTNVLLDIYSCHDAFQTYDRVYGELNAMAINEASVVYRRARARESLLLGMYFNKIAATSFSLHNETVVLLTKRAPPAPGGRTPESDFTTVFIHFVKDYVLPNWHPTMPTAPGSEIGSAADLALIAYAQAQGVPLITNEGYTQTGIAEDEPRSLRTIARNRRVQVLTPREFWQGKIDHAEEIGAFLKRFRDQAPRYIEARRWELGEDNVGEVLDWVYGYYRLVLLGEAEGRDHPVRVTVV